MTSHLDAFPNGELNNDANEAHKKARPKPGIDSTKVKGGTFVEKSPEGLGLTTL